MSEQEDQEAPKQFTFGTGKSSILQEANANVDIVGFDAR